MATKTELDYTSAEAGATSNDIDEALRYLDTHHWSGEPQHKRLIAWALQHLKADICAMSDSPRLRAMAERIEDQAAVTASNYLTEVSRI